MRKLNQRGSALIVVAGIMAALSAGVDAVLMNFDSNLRSLESYSSKKQAFYMSEGTRSLVTVLLEGYMMINANPTAEELSTYLNSALPPLLPSPYSVSSIVVNILKVQPNGIITSGPFKGMNGPITDLQVKFNVLAPSSLFGGNLLEPLEMKLSVAFISMFQFMAFYDIAKAEINTGPPMDMDGRLHANGDLCIGGSSSYESFLKVTVGNRLIHNSDARCGNAGFTKVRIATGASFGAFANLNNNADNGCTNCEGTGLSWDAFAIAKWHEQALDKAHSVQLLKLPGAGQGLVQTREAGAFGAPVSNLDNLRFIVDPILGTDNLSVQSYKFAFNSDIRIINGVWYLRDPANPANWPGLPIWSDHPGRYSENGIAVGQDDIRDRWQGTNPWPATPLTPRNFSYYEYDATNQTIQGDPAGTGVISYGNLSNTGAGVTSQKPGHWINSNASSLCFGGANLDCGPGGCGLKSVWQGGTYSCQGAIFPGSNPSYATNILNATRGGFRNGHINEISPPPAADRDKRSKILPINFDVAQFQTALTNVNSGELGSYFGNGSVMGRPFNGVIWISSQWPGSNNGYGNGGPTEHPWQGTVADVNQVGITHPAVQQALPQPLCSTSAAGLPYDAQDITGTLRTRFRVPNCASYTGGGPIQAWPNTIRVINGSVLDRGRLTKGLTIASNLPAYLVGDFNTNSVVTDVSAMPWTPALIAGDKVALISKNWQDSRSRWDQSPSATNRPAASTTYNTALLTEPSDTLTVLLEDWTNKDLLINGSMVYGYNAVYAMHDNVCCGNKTYDPPDRTFRFDPHFSLINNQPPGTPAFPVSAIAMWTKAQ